MLSQLDYLRDFNTASVFLRLILALVMGGLIGLDRGLRHRPAGPRTYTLVCIGASLTMVLSQYEYVMLTTDWAPMAEAVGLKTDVSRFGAQVINGIGFLGAGTVIATNQQKVKGLTTASGLWASACLGLVIGAGFYEAAFFAFLIILATMWLLRPVEEYFIERSRNLNIYGEVRSMGNQHLRHGHPPRQGADHPEAERGPVPAHAPSKGPSRSRRTAVRPRRGLRGQRAVRREEHHVFDF